MYLVSGAVAISFSPVWVAGATVGPDIAAFYRCLIGGVVLAIGLGVRKERLRFSSQNLRLAAAAIVFFAVDLALWHAAIGYIGPGLSTLLGNFQVFLLAAVGIVWLKEPADWRFLLSVPLALGGLFLLVGRQWDQVSGDFRFGVGLGLTVAFAYAAFTLTLRRAQSVPSALSPAANLMIVSLGVAAVMAPLAALRGEAFILPDAWSWTAMGLYGAVSQALGWWLISRGLRSVPASRAGLILVLQPALSFVWDVLLFARPTDALDALGVALTLLAIYLGTMSSQR